ncbi:major facilitator superfamily domain-containing protein [Calycina marina]|uniref:Major facilitator superfamily domain-containing protein n=1 Tax=Calycina marina TaxID=1763456 RepID=A0A9P7YZB6_9HELO|nr:major facilitator superfamily domain-containing protein [Calycina marina]
MDDSTGLQSMRSKSKAEVVEQQSLLYRPDTPSHIEQNVENTVPKNTVVSWISLPNKGQLMILAMCRVSEPLSNSTLLAYIFYLLQTTLSTPSSTPSNAEIARVSGLLVAMFPFGQFLTSFLWGWLSDVYGRKPVIVFGLVVSVIANMGFGFSLNFESLLFWRFIAGLANGNTGVMRSMTAEIVEEKKHRARAFMLLPLVFSTGRILGMAFGGVFADPVKSLPHIFGTTGALNVSKTSGGVAWMIHYPYAFPMIVNSAFMTAALILANFKLSETAPGRRQQMCDLAVSWPFVVRSAHRLLRKSGSTRYTAVETDEKQLEAQGENNMYGSAQPKRCAIWNRKTIRVIIFSGLLPLHNGAFTHLFAVFLSTPIAASNPSDLFHSAGGLGLTSQSIGIVLAILGISGIILKFFTYPPVHAHFGTLRTIWISLLLFPVAYFATPFLALISEQSIWRWLCVVSLLLTQIMARGFIIPCSIMLLTDSVYQKGALGRVHGAANMLGSLAKALAPLIGGWIFSRGIEMNCIGMAWWFWLTPIAFVSLAWSFLLSDVDKIGEEIRSSHDI